jgi:hypothetical protein
MQRANHIEKSLFSGAIASSGGAVVFPRRELSISKPIFA